MFRHDKMSLFLQFSLLRALVSFSKTGVTWYLAKELALLWESNQ